MKKKHYLLTLLILITAVSFAILVVITNTKPSKIQIEILDLYNLYEDNSFLQLKINNQVFNLEVAKSKALLSRGLMNRESLEAQSGMVFLFPDEDFRSFWMKDTYISLDIIFLDSSLQIVDYYKNTKPNQTKEVYKSRKKSKYVVELLNGTIEKYDIQIGNIFELINK